MRMLSWIVRGVLVSLVVATYNFARQAWLQPDPWPRDEIDAQAALDQISVELRNICRHGLKNVTRADLEEAFWFLEGRVGECHDAGTVYGKTHQWTPIARVHLVQYMVYSLWHGTQGRMRWMSDQTLKDLVFCTAIVADGESLDLNLPLIYSKFPGARPVLRSSWPWSREKTVA